MTSAEAIEAAVAWWMLTSNAQNAMKLASKGRNDVLYATRRPHAGVVNTLRPDNVDEERFVTVSSLDTPAETRASEGMQPGPRHGLFDTIVSWRPGTPGDERSRRPHCKAIVS